MCDSDCIFDQRISRDHTNSLKYDFRAARHKPADVLPLWVADMDFRSPPAVREAVADAAQHGIFGYSESREGYFEALRGWYESRFGWALRPEWLVKTPGVVFAICTAVRALTEPGDAVLIQPPVYYPFREAVCDNGRVLVTNPLDGTGGRYTIDFDDFEQKIAERHVRLFLLCSPHNPVGRVWTRQELLRMGEICLRHGVTIVSDEIHGDLVYAGHRQHVLASLSPELAACTVTCTSPSKTFNMAGLQISNIFIPNPLLRARFQQELQREGYSQPNAVGIAACEAAYRHGQSWLGGLLEYLEQNLRLVEQTLAQRLPEVRLVRPEGTYLLWLDFRALKLSDPQLEDLLLKKAKLWLDAGSLFGEGGSGFARINIACPRAVLGQALAQLTRAVENIRPCGAGRASAV